MNWQSVCCSVYRHRQFLSRYCAGSWHQAHCGADGRWHSGALQCTQRRGCRACRAPQCCKRATWRVPDEHQSYHPEPESVCWPGRTANALVRARRRWHTGSRVRCAAAAAAISAAAASISEAAAWAAIQYSWPAHAACTTRHAATPSSKVGVRPYSIRAAVWRWCAIKLLTCAANIPTGLPAAGATSICASGERIVTKRQSACTTAWW